MGARLAGPLSHRILNHETRRNAGHGVIQREGFIVGDDDRFAR